MKKAILTILIASFASLTTQAQWTKISAGTGRQLNKVFFPSKNVGYVIPYNGLLLRTLDSGKSWDSLISMELTSGSSHGVNDIFFLNDNLGFVTTLDQNKPRVFKTTDMGSTNTWEDITPDGMLYSVPEVQFLDENTGYLFANNGWDGQLWKTTDGGKSWTDLSPTVNVGSGTANIPSMLFTDENTGYLTGGDGTFAYRGIIARTTDGGKNWSVTTLPSYTVLSSIHFPTKDTGYAISGMYHAGCVFRTTNGGQTWDSMTTLHTTYGNQVFFADSKTGFVLSEFAIYKTTDAGANWTEQNPGTTIPMRSIFFTDKDNGFIVGDSGLVLQTTNGGASGFQRMNTDLQPRIFPNPSKDIFNFQADGLQGSTIEIFDGLGHQILSQPVEDSARIDLSTQPVGIYYYRILGRNISTGKLIKH